ncbi:MAG: 4Fe-4S binding protein, partial [Limnochordia bacterium]
MNLIYPEFEVARNTERCTKCGICVKQCPNGVHALKVDPTTGEQKLAADDSRCVDCQHCVVFCPVRALKIVKSGNVYR